MRRLIRWKLLLRCVVVSPYSTPFSLVFCLLFCFGVCNSIQRTEKEKRKENLRTYANKFNATVFNVPSCELIIIANMTNLATLAIHAIPPAANNAMTLNFLILLKFMPQISGIGTMRTAISVMTLTAVSAKYSVLTSRQVACGWALRSQYADIGLQMNILANSMGM